MTKPLTFLVFQMIWIVGFNNFTKLSRVQGEKQKKWILAERLTDLFPCKSLGGGKGYGDSRVKMSTRDVADRIDHHHYNQTPNN